MHDHDAEAEAIIQEIYEAFRGVPRGEITLHEALVIDDNGTEAEHLEARELDTESRWEDIPDEHIEHGADVFSHLDPVSKRYYLPRFMIWLLVYRRVRESSIPECILFHLDPWPKAMLRSSPDPESQKAWFLLLNREQSAVVCRFLRHMANEGVRGDLNHALKCYWGQFCPESPG